MFGERDEPINDLIAEGTKPSRKEWKQIHDNIAKIIHLELCQKVRWED